MANTKPIQLILLTCLACAAINVEGLPLEGRETVLSPPGGVIYVLANTTAWFNWTHTLRDMPVLEWNFISNDGSIEKLMTYAEGKLHNRQGSERYGYIESIGSAKMYLKNVHTRDDGNYQVRISPQGVISAIDSNTVELRVLSPTEIGVRIRIDGIQADITVADNGTDVLLPDDRVIRTPTPDVKLEKLYAGPWIASSYHMTTNTEYKNELPNKSIMKCSRDRMESSDIIISVTFDIQNLDEIRITKPVHAPASWTNTPGHIRVLAHTTALFNWTHDVERADIEWYYGPSNMTGHSDLTFIMGFTGTKLHMSVVGDRHFRIHSDRNPCGADLKLHNVHKGDEGWYRVTVVDVDSPSRYHISNMAEMSVIEDTDLHYQIGVGPAIYGRSVSNSGTDVILPDAYVILRSSELNVYINIAESAPVPDIIRIHFAYTNDGDSEAKTVGLECHETRLCEGYIPVTDLAVDLEARITGTIDFGIQNLGLVSVHMRAVLQPETDTHNNGADTFTSVSRSLVYITAAAMVII